MSLGKEFFDYIIERSTDFMFAGYLFLDKSQLVKLPFKILFLEFFQNFDHLFQFDVSAQYIPDKDLINILNSLFLFFQCCLSKCLSRRYKLSEFSLYVEMNYSLDEGGDVRVLEHMINLYYGCSRCVRNGGYF